MLPLLRLQLQRLAQYVEECRLVMSWVDLLDIALIGAFLSVALVWLQRRAARAVLFALVPLLATFAAARELKMYMTSELFRFGLLSLVVVIVVIFQDDFRRAFESLASWRPWGRRRSTHPSKLGELLTDCLTTLAKTKTGALIVLQGRQSIEPHVRAGIPLHGQLSAPLLLSIFDPHTPGHDGGVTIADGRVDRFGVHLPLSRDSGATGRLGTRHAAALGLAEKCDALILVVSEETGTVSIAQDRRLRAAKSERELKDAIVSHCKRVGPVAVHRSFLEVPWARLTASFSMAMALWLAFARPANLMLRTVEATIVYRGLPKGWEARPPEPSKVRVTLFGPEGPLMKLDPATMAVAVDLIRVAEGQQRFVLSDSNVNLPARVRTKRFDPPEVMVHAYPTQDLELPVQPSWLDAGGRAPGGGQIRVEPTHMTVRIPKTGMPPSRLETEPVDPRELRRTGRIKAKVRAPAEVPSAELPVQEVEIMLLPN